MTGSTVKVRPAPTFDHLKKKRPQELVRYIPIDGGEAAEDLRNATHELERARMIGDAARTEEAEARLEEARRTAQDPAHSVRCVFRAVGRTKYNAIKAECPPSKADVDAAKEAKEDPPDWDAEAFLPLLISNTMVEPALTPEQVQSLSVPEGEETESGLPGLGWNEAEVSSLFEASILVNNSTRITDFSF